MTEETPGKVLGLLAAACASLLMLFLVSYSNASFTGTEVAMPDPFAPEKVVAVIDNAAASYSRFVAVNLTGPATQDYAFVSDNVSWVWQQTEPQLASAVGLSELPPQGQVAGAYIVNPDAVNYQENSRGDSGGFSIDTIYSILIR